MHFIHLESATCIWSAFNKLLGHFLKREVSPKNFAIACYLENISGKGKPGVAASSIYIPHTLPSSEHFYKWFGGNDGVESPRASPRTSVDPDSGWAAIIFSSCDTLPVSSTIDALICERLASAIAAFALI